MVRSTGFGIIQVVSAADWSIFYSFKMGGHFLSFVSTIFFSLVSRSLGNDSLDRSNITFNAISAKFASSPADNPCVSWWQSANMYEEIANFALNPQVDAASMSTASTILNKMLHKVLLTIPVFELSSSNDDVLWWCLAFEKSYTLTKNEKFLRLADMTLKHVMRDWTDTCNGGLLWDHKKTYKNAITNELLLSASTKLYQTTKDNQYLDIAVATWNWFNASGMIDPIDGLIDDGLADSPDCSAVYQSCPWTYNQGVILSGLARLANQTGDSSLLTIADSIINHVLSSDCLMYGEEGILRESCENSDVNGCNTDQKIFKGIFARHLVYFYLELSPSERTSRSELITDFITTNANSSWSNNRQLDTEGFVVFGPQWNEYVDDVASGDECVSDVSSFSLFNAALNLQVL